jgi:hypothetical protein
MESVLVSLVSMAMVILSTVIMTVSTFHSASKIADAWRTMEQISSGVARTEISAVPPAAYQGGPLESVVENNGHTNMSDFASWDVIVQYQSGSSRYLAYSLYPPAEDQWAIKEIYIAGGQPEVFDLGILDPAELMTVSLNLATEIAAGEMAKVTISTSNGVTSQCFVARGSP